MVAVNNIIQGVSGGKQGTQSKVAAKEGNALNGDFLMALFAAADGQQSTATDDTQLLLGKNPDQQQSATEEHQNPLAQLMEMVPMDVLSPSSVQELMVEVQAQLKEAQQTGEAPKQVEAVLLGQLESLLADLQQPQPTSELKETLPQAKMQLPNQLSVQLDAKPLGKQEGLRQQVPTELQQVLTEMLNQLQEQQPTGGVPKQVEAAQLGKLESLLPNPQLQLIPELKEVLQQVQVQQAKQPSADLKISNEQQPAKTVDIANEIQQMPPNKQNQLLEAAGLKQQPVEAAVKAGNLIAELPKAGLMLQNKAMVEVQPTEQNAVKQQLSITSQFVKPASERPVEQVMQHAVKNTEASVQNTGQQTISPQSTDHESFGTVMHNKVTGMDAKVELIQPEQLSGKLLGMVKEMATKQQPNQTTMHLKLNPEHLGEVTVRLTYNRGELNAQFYAATTHGKEALEAALPQMKDALFQQQVKLNEAAVYLNNGSSQWQGGRQSNQSGNRGRSQGGYCNNNSFLPKVDPVTASNNRVIDDGLNILV